MLPAPAATGFMGAWQGDERVISDDHHNCTTGATGISGIAYVEAARRNGVANMGSRGPAGETGQVRGQQSRKVGIDCRVVCPGWVMVAGHTVRGSGQIPGGRGRDYSDGPRHPCKALCPCGRVWSTCLALQPTGARVRSFRRLAARRVGSMRHPVSRLPDLARYEDRSQCLRDRASITNLPDRASPA